MTSKSKDDLKTYGYRGESLSSLVQLSGMLQIISRITDPNTGGSKFNSNPAYSVSFHRGERNAVSEYVHPFEPEHGTLVTVIDFFYNLPVR